MAKPMTDAQMERAMLAVFREVEGRGQPISYNRHILARVTPGRSFQRRRVFQNLLDRQIITNTGPDCFRIRHEYITDPDAVIAALWTLHPLSERRPDAYAQALDEVAPFDSTQDDYIRLYEEALSVCRSNLHRFPPKTIAVLRVALSELIAMQNRMRQ